MIDRNRKETVMSMFEAVVHASSGASFTSAVRSLFESAAGDQEAEVVTAWPCCCSWLRG